MIKKPIAITHPEIASQWHPTLNADLTPSDVTSGSRKKVWWKCPKGDDHEWIASVFERANGSGCPICSGRKLGNSNSLSFLYPDISKLWHKSLNGNLKPSGIIAGSHKKVWWKCPKGDDHEWIASPNTLIENKKNTKSNGCPVCRGVKIVESNSLKYFR